MKFKEVLDTIKLEEIVEQYFYESPVIEDIGVNELFIKALVWNYGRVLKKYKDYECLYNKDDMYDYVIDTIWYNIPEMCSCLLKNNIMISKMFRKFTDMSYSNYLETETENSYSGFNADDTFNKNKTKSQNKNYDPVGMILSLNVDFRNQFRKFCKKIENYLQIIY